MRFALYFFVMSVQTKYKFNHVIRKAFTRNISYICLSKVYYIYCFNPESYSDGPSSYIFIDLFGLCSPFLVQWCLKKFISHHRCYVWLLGTQRSSLLLKVLRLDLRGFVGTQKDLTGLIGDQEVLK